LTTPRITVDEGARENGLAVMLADLLDQNMEQNPAKVKHFQKLRAVVAISAIDAEVKLTLFFNKGSCTVYNGLVGKPDLHIECDSETILGLSTVPLLAGLPDVTKVEGRKMIGQILSRKLIIHGMLTHPVTTILLTKLFSVN